MAVNLAQPPTLLAQTKFARRREVARETSRSGDAASHRRVTVQHATSLSLPPHSKIRRSRKLSDMEVVRHGSCPTKPNLTTHEFVGELPCRTTSVSDKFRLSKISIAPGEADPLMHRNPYLFAHFLHQFEVGSRFVRPQVSYIKLFVSKSATAL